MEVLHRPTDVEELVDAALASLGPRGAEVTVSVDADVPRVETDPVLLERVVANLVDNALLHGAGPAGPGRGRERWPAGSTSGWSTTGRASGPPTATASSSRSSGSATPTTGPASGWDWPCRGASPRPSGGELDLEDTPGGGCTMVVRLPGDPATDDRRPMPVDADARRRRRRSATGRVADDDADGRRRDARDRPGPRADP